MLLMSSQIIVSFIEEGFYKLFIWFCTLVRVWQVFIIIIIITAI